jgi:hypothetical protein
MNGIRIRATLPINPNLLINRAENAAITRIKTMYTGLPNLLAPVSTSNGLTLSCIMSCDNFFENQYNYRVCNL